MKKITVISPTSESIPKKQRVAAYARVSMETERLMHSLSQQISYYSEYIQANPNWEYVGVYADRFLSGTSTEKRPEFQRLIQDCMDGKIDIVLCKSISRFARNTVDLLQTVRQLKSKGIDVRFEKENISTLSESGEIMLSLLASFAQEESKSISENCKWGIRKKFADGSKAPSNKRVFGYYYDGSKYVVVPKEAEVVVYIFNRYLEGATYTEIARELNDKGIRTVRDNEFDDNNSIRKILRNPIYVGTMLYQKTYTTDPISRHKVLNNGELPKYMVANAHEAIISQEMFDSVQTEIAKRAEKIVHSVFSKRLKCSVCGLNFTRKAHYHKGKLTVYWMCAGVKRKKYGSDIHNVHVKESDLMSLCSHLLNTEEFDPKLFESSINRIDVLKDRGFIFYFWDGNVIEWHPLLKGGYDGINRQKCFTRLIRCGCCGELYTRTGANKIPIWGCSGKWRKQNYDVDHSMNYNESDLARICQHVLRLKEVNEQEFRAIVKEIIIQKDGNIIFRLKDGSEKTWVRM